MVRTIFRHEFPDNAPKFFGRLKTPRRRFRDGGGRNPSSPMARRFAKILFFARRHEKGGMAARREAGGIAAYGAQMFR